MRVLKHTSTVDGLPFAMEMWESLTTKLLIKAKRVVCDGLGQPGVNPASFLTGWKKLVSFRTPGQLEPLTQLDRFRLSAHAVGSSSRLCDGCWLWTKKRLTQTFSPEKGGGSISHNSSNISACSLAPLQSVVLWQMRQSLRNIWRKLLPHVTHSLSNSVWMRLYCECRLCHYCRV